MHELSLCQSILEIIKEQMINSDYKQVKVIHLEMGQLAAIEQSALLLSFEVIKQGTVAEHAILNIIPIEGRAWCDACQIDISIHQYYDPCPQCGNHALKIIAGEDLRVKSIEVT